MEKINSILYNYISQCRQQERKQLLKKQYAEIDSYFTFDRRHFSENAIPVIFEYICRIENLNSRIICEQDIVNSINFQKAAKRILNSLIMEDRNSIKSNRHFNIILQGIFRKAWDKTKNFMSSTFDSAKQVISSGYDLLKKIGNAVWDGIKKLGQTFVNTVKGLYNCIKEGLKIGKDAAAGGKCGMNSPEDLSERIHSLQENVKTGAPFMSSAVDKAAEHPSGISTKHLDKTLATGGNAGKQLDEITKKVGQSAAEQIGNQLKTNGMSAAKKQNKELLKTIPEEQIKNLKNSSGQSDSSDKLIYEFNCSQVKKYQQELLKEWILRDCVYKGITPKMAVQRKYGISFGSSQGDIIIGESVFSFKTNNGFLICQQTNINSNDKIIYESDQKFRGSHLIYEQTENRYRKFNKIISQQTENETNKIIEEAIAWGAVIAWGAMTVGILVILAVLAAIIIAVVSACTAGTGGIAGKIIDACAHPFETVFAAIKGFFTTTATAATTSTTAASTAASTGATAATAAATTGASSTGSLVSSISGISSTAKITKSAANAVKKGYDATLGNGIDLGQTSNQLGKMTDEVDSQSEEDLLNQMG